MTSPAPITVVSGTPFAHEEPKTCPVRLDAEPDPGASAVASGLGYDSFTRRAFVAAAAARLAL